MQNPIDTPTKLTTTTTNTNTSVITVNRSSSSTLASTSQFGGATQNLMQSYANSSMSSSASQLPQYQASSSPPTITESYYTTQSLTTPIKGIIPKLQHEESKGIPIPGRAQSHDDIRMLGAPSSSYGSPNSNYGVSPNSPRGSQYMYGCSPNSSSGFNASPPIRNTYGSYASTTAISGSVSGGGVGSGSGMGNNMTARRAISRAASPLSSSVPCNINTTGIMASKASPSTSNSRYIAVSKNCSRSDQMCPFSYAKQTNKHTFIFYFKTHARINIKSYILLFL